MKDIRKSSEIFGLWAAIPMPWTAAGQLNAGMLQRNIDRLAAVPCDGIYTTDSDGEFYALEIGEFREFIGTLADCLTPYDCGVQVGATWTNVNGIIERMKICLDNGISAVHICYPYWMPLNDNDVKHFWHDLASAVPEARWIHYNTPRGHVIMTGQRYRWLAQEFPEQFIGTKLGTQNFLELSEIIGATPHIAHVVTDFVTVPAMMLGARGVYSFWVNTLPNWQRRLMKLCLENKWGAAMSMQLKFNRWECECVEAIVRQGYLHGIVGKARCATSRFLEDDGFTRAPYYPVPEDVARQLSVRFAEWWSVELEEEDFRVVNQ
jgi:dihydrodipicolinate synthase/N-acetylneuraminate lyase